MLKRMTVGLLTIAICTAGFSCAVPPSDGGNGGGDGGAIADFVGALTVASSRTHGSIGTTVSLSANSVFTTVETTPDENAETKTIGDCVVTTTTVSMGDVPTVDPLDAGLSGMLSTASAEATLVKQVEGVYASGELGEDFNTGETYTFEFDGGTDIAGFMTSIVLPGELTSTTPDLSDDALSIDKTAALDVAWAPSGSADGVTVQVNSADLTTFVTIVCTFNDTGSATVPQEAMDCLLDAPTTTTVSIARTNSAEIDVELTDGGTGTLIVTAQTGEAATIIESLDTGGTDPCELIQQFICQEGETCNPLTLQCE